MAFRRKKKEQAILDAVQEPEVDPAERGTMTLVMEPGPVKHVHFDSRGRAIPASSAPPAAPAVVDAPFEELPDEPAPVLKEATEEPSARRSGRRKTVYETSRGNEVIRYEKNGKRSFATTGPEGERPFDPATDVDPLIGGVVFQETVAAPAPGADALQTYHEVIPVTERPKSAPARPVLQEAWSPGPAPRPARKAKARKPRKAAPKPKPKKRAKRKPHSDFPGDDHLVIDLEGIGPVYAKKLQKQGVYTTSRLAFESPGNLAKRIKVPRKVVKGWSSMAELIKVNGIGKQYAEVLFRAGVKGIDDLKHREPEALAKKVNKYLRSVDTTVIGTGVHAKRAKGWIKAAKTMRRRPIPVPRKGPPQTETVKGFIEKVVPYGSKPKKAAKKAKPAKRAKKPAKRPSRPTSQKGKRGKKR